MSWFSLPCQIYVRSVHAQAVRLLLPEYGWARNAFGDNRHTMQFWALVATWTFCTCWWRGTPPTATSAEQVLTTQLPRRQQRNPNMSISFWKMLITVAGWLSVGHRGLWRSYVSRDTFPDQMTHRLRRCIVCNETSLWPAEWRFLVPLCVDKSVCHSCSSAKSG